MGQRRRRARRARRARRRNRRQTRIGGDIPPIPVPEFNYSENGN